MPGPAGITISGSYNKAKVQGFRARQRAAAVERDASVTFGVQRDARVTFANRCLGNKLEPIKVERIRLNLWEKKNV